MNPKVKTDKKNTLNDLSKKESIFKIKQNLFHELTTQSSLKMKYKDKDELNNKYINFSKTRNNEENRFPDNDIINEDYFFKKNNHIIKKRNKNDYNQNSKNKSYKTLTVIKSNNNFNNKEDDLIYIITKAPNKNEKKNSKKNNNKDDNIISHLALPFCHYHKFNLKLPKRYTCNFKNCSCCEFKDRQNFLYNENTKESSRDYIYPSKEKTQRSCKRYNNVLEKYLSKNKNKNKNKCVEEKKDNKIKKDKIYIKKKLEDNSNIKTKKNLNNKKALNINLKKSNNYNDERKNSKSNGNSGTEEHNNFNNNSEESINSEQMSNISLKFQKPDETNLKVPKKKLEKMDNSLSESFTLEMPDEINIKDEEDLKEFKNLVNEKNRKSKIHFSVTYYQKLNKSYKVYSNEEKKASPFKAKSKEKKFEFLRYN